MEIQIEFPFSNQIDVKIFDTTPVQGFSAAIIFSNNIITISKGYANSYNDKRNVISINFHFSNIDMDITVTDSTYDKIKNYNIEQFIEFCYSIVSQVIAENPEYIQKLLDIVFNQGVEVGEANIKKKFKKLMGLTGI